MSNLTLARSRIGVIEDADVYEPSNFVSLTFQPRGQSAANEAWQQFNARLRGNLQRAGFPQPDEVMEEGRSPTEAWRIVAPGMIMRSNEYRERYGVIDLAALQNRMSPVVFEAFVRHIGIISGREQFDVEDLLEEPDV